MYNAHVLVIYMQSIGMRYTLNQRRRNKKTINETVGIALRLGNQTDALRMIS